jgi:hypothetical protein
LATGPPDERFAGVRRAAEDRPDVAFDLAGPEPDFVEDFAFVERCGPRPALPRPRVVEPLAMPLR